MSWESWLDERISWKGFTFIRRRAAVWKFVSEGLVPFLYERGYSLIPSAEDLTCMIAAGLWVNEGRSCMESDWAMAVPRNKDFIPEERWHYDHVCGPEEWEQFWSQWGSWADVNLESERGIDRRIDIQEFCWSQLDLDASRQTQILNGILGLTDDSQQDSARQTAQDTYLREAAESREWEGRRR